MMSVNLSDIISLISKNEAINLIQKANLTEKKWNIINHEKCIISYIKMGKEILTFEDIEIKIFLPQ